MYFTTQMEHAGCQPRFLSPTRLRQSLCFVCLSSAIPSSSCSIKCSEGELSSMTGVDAPLQYKCADTCNQWAYTCSSCVTAACLVWIRTFHCIPKVYVRVMCTRMGGNSPIPQPLLWADQVESSSSSRPRLQCWVQVNTPIWPWAFLSVGIKLVVYSRTAYLST